jgi:hypothetical protein
MVQNRDEKYFFMHCDDKKMRRNAAANNMQHKFKVVKSLIVKAKHDTFTR